MNDRYLYRAKRTNNGELVEGNLVWSDDAVDDYKAIIIPTTDSNMFTRGGARGDLGFENWCRVDPSTICRCTGLKDKNGKLIWENDILMAYLDEDHPEDVTYAKIEWNGSGWITHENNNEDQEYFDDFVLENYEVVGNIFDNPGLLEV